MTGNPYYSLLGLLEDTSVRLAVAVLSSVEEETFLVEGRPASMAGRAKGLVIEATDEGGSFLCAGSREGWFVLCRLEET
ncbi:MAG: hypothetical protein IKU58_06195 [Clostridia bacterium]|nr:hypothetical protein [Clostridia bacterium]